MVFVTVVFVVLLTNPTHFYYHHRFVSHSIGSRKESHVEYECTSGSNDTTTTSRSSPIASSEPKECFLLFLLRIHCYYNFKYKNKYKHFR